MLIILYSAEKNVSIDRGLCIFSPLFYTPSATQMFQVGEKDLAMRPNGTGVTDIFRV